MIAAGRALPSGTVTFLFTDIEGSTRLLQQLGPDYGAQLEEHRRLVRATVDAQDGLEVNTEGDAFFFVFASAAHAAAAALAAQRALAGHRWPEHAVVRVRMGLHTGEPTLAGRDYVGLDVHRVARICAAGHGGQVLLSAATKTLVESALPPGCTLKDLGEHRLKDLLRPERLFQLIAPDARADFPPLRTLDAVPNNLPIQLTSFVGREREVRQARQVLESARLLTLTGPGGTGKTRLALQVAAEVSDRFREGVYFVSLGPITDPVLVMPTIATTLGVAESGTRSPLARLGEHLHDKQLLLVLDNFEQVMPAAPLVSDLLRSSPGVKVLATSRAALRVYGEHEFPVPPLQLPDGLQHLTVDALARNEAVALFLQRAAAVKPDFTLTSENAQAVAEITARLDGLPLAIELAATRVKLLPPQSMLARLNRRLDLLGSGARDLPSRQQTLRGAIAWSYDLLDQGVQRLMARLAVFVGGCTLQDAETVCGPAGETGAEVLDGLATLVDQSLLRQEDVSGEPRFMMLETVREFARERLEMSGALEEISRRHTLAFLALAERAEPHLTGAEQARWLDRLEREHDNLRAAIAWSMEHAEVTAGLRFGAALWRFWQMRGHLREGRERLTSLLAMRDVPHHRTEHAAALEAAGGIAYWQGDLDAARGFYEESLARQRETGDPASIARALYNLAFAFFISRGDVDRADLDRALALLEESLALWQTAGERAGVAKAHWALSSMLEQAGDYPGSLEHLNASLPVFRELDDRFSLGWGLHQLGLVGLKTRDHAMARSAWEEGLGLFAEARDVSGIALLLDDLGSLALAEGDLERAARLAGAATALQTSSGTDLATIIGTLEGRERLGHSDLREFREGMLAAFGQAQALTAAWQEGRAAPLEEIVAYALRRPPRNAGAG
jgi:predicted ATPase/class 3 adenylate cyclase